MAKALFGHVGKASDAYQAAEIRRLRARVQELEVDLARTRAVNQALIARVDVPADLRSLDAEPALT